MKVTITVKDKSEAEAIRIAMNDPTTRATVLVVGTLLGLPDVVNRRAAMLEVIRQLKLPTGD